MNAKFEHLNLKRNMRRKITVVPEPTLKRLPLYLNILKKAHLTGVENISAPYMAEELVLDPTQIVKDLSVTGIKGKPKVGYNIKTLIQAIEEYLGFNRNNEAFLVGAGKLGQALLSYHELQGFGVNIIAAFDVSPEKINTNYGNIQILHIDKMGELAGRLGVKIGVLTTPGDVAQAAAEAMTKSGIQAIWNLTPVKLRLPKNIIVQDTSMYSNVAVLLRKLHNQES